MQIQAIGRPSNFHARFPNINLHGLEILPATHDHHFDGGDALTEQEGGPCCSQIVKANSWKPQACKEHPQLTGLFALVPIGDARKHEFRTRVLEL